jgi:hypothetical protein
MKMNVLTTLILVTVVAITTLGATSFAASNSGASDKNSGEALLNVMQANNTVNETEGGRLALRDWNNFVENVDYDSQILNSTRAGNTTFGEGMVFTTALLTLNTQALAEAQLTKPGAKYADFHNYTINAMQYFNVHLYNMAKLFETRDARYGQIAADAYNISEQYYQKGRDEAELLY